MPRPCTICSHPKRIEIGKAHLEGRAYRGIARDFAVGEDAVGRHLKAHLPAAAQRARAAASAREVLQGDGILAELAELSRDAKRLQAKAERRGNLAVAISAVRELARQVELKARIIGELRDKQISVQTVVLDPGTAERMATIFLQRRRQTTGVPAVSIETLEMSGEGSHDVDSRSRG